MYPLLSSLSAALLLTAASAALGQDSAQISSDAAPAQAASESEPEVVTQTPMLGVGDSIPADFKALDSFGREASFESLKGEKGLLILFTRSAEWCQYCKAQITLWDSRIDELSAKGYKLATLSYDKPEVLRAFAEQHNLKQTLLSDTNSAMIKRFGILNDKFEEDSRFYGIPNPAIYIFDAAGVITYVFREEGFKVRPDIEEVMAALDGKAPKAQENTPNEGL